MTMKTSWTEPAKPTEVGQRVRTHSWGGNVRQWMANGSVTGTVLRFTAKGTPIVLLDGYAQGDRHVVEGNALASPLVNDTYSCFRRIDDAGAWINETVEVTS